MTMADVDGRQPMIVAPPYPTLMKVGSGHPRQEKALHCIARRTLRRKAACISTNVAAMAASTASTSSALSFANLSASRSAVVGSPVSSARTSAPAAKLVGPVVCRAQKPSEACDVSVSRRSTLSLMAAAAAAVAAIAAPTSPAHAAYGEAANIFGAPKKDSGFTTVVGDGFKIDIPSKWNPSKEQEFPGTVIRYEDNFDANSNVCVLVLPAEKSSIKDYGSPEKFLSTVAFLLGKQAYSGNTKSEGGFDPNAVATAAILETSTPSVNGKDYYSISVLTRTADGDEGGKHQLIVATVSGGKLYVCKAQAGDKRWFKGAKKFVEGSANSFSVA
ncbi:hypothetical protein KP509_27G052700 [Ceratopteris richardii]|uniref:23 kDa subunit of oxygen evolving system of photosystem II n=1 Tax=Ceratopteris richardii TaxID=49495 RepID=A0A8T2RIV1_CERRI|nr:hypothetical protein KP509_27G052700 [Ceratopteris richardii]